MHGFIFYGGLYGNMESTATHYRYLIFLWRAAVHNEAQSFSTATPLQPRTEAGLLTTIAGGIGVGAVGTQLIGVTSATTTIIMGVAGLIPGVVLLVGLLLVLMPPW